MPITWLYNLWLIHDSFIGGEILHTLAHAGHSDLHITSLVRDASKAQQVQSAYPEVKTILGDLDDIDLIKEQSKAADVVLSTFSLLLPFPHVNLIARLCCHRTRSQCKGYCRGSAGPTQRNKETRLLDSNIGSDSLCSRRDWFRPVWQRDR